MNSELQAVLDDVGISVEQVKTLLEALKVNPMGALSVIQGWGLPPEKLQKLVGFAMTNRALLEDIAKEAGVSQDTLNNM
jgi:hypothetical protein